MNDLNEKFGMGWLPDYPDFRDYTGEHEEIKPMVRKLKIMEPFKAPLPSSVDLRLWCSPIENQGALGSCTANDGKIPYPCRGERILGGHAIVTVGYDEKMKIKNTVCGKETKGALLIRNSWGTGWGDKGYGWLPYEYVLKGLAIDWWTLLKAEWVDTKKFGF